MGIKCVGINVIHHSKRDELTLFWSSLCVFKLHKNYLMEIYAHQTHTHTQSWFCGASTINQSYLQWHIYKISKQFQNWKQPIPIVGFIEQRLVSAIHSFTFQIVHMNPYTHANFFECSMDLFISHRSLNESHTVFDPFLANFVQINFTCNKLHEIFNFQLY